MELQTCSLVHQAVRSVAIQQGRSYDELMEQIRRTIYLGVHSNDSKVREAWRSVPCAGSVPTPEEAVAYWAEKRMMTDKSKE